MSFLRKDKTKSHLRLSTMVPAGQHQAEPSGSGGAKTPASTAKTPSNQSSNTPSNTSPATNDIVHTFAPNGTNDTHAPVTTPAPAASQRQVQRQTDGQSDTEPRPVARAHKSAGDHPENSVLSFQFQSIGRRQPLTRASSSGTPHSNVSTAPLSSSLPATTNAPLSPGTLDSRAAELRDVRPADGSPDPERVPLRPPGDGYSPRSSYAVLPTIPGAHDAEPGPKESYMGFHRSRGSQQNVPPLAQPIKPRFKKKGSLLGKLIHSNRKDSDASFVSDSSDQGSVQASINSPVDSSGPRKSVSSHASGKHKFRLPSISQHYHPATHTPSDASRHPSVSEDSEKCSDRSSGVSSKKNSVTGLGESPSAFFDLNLNFDDLQTIVKNPTQDGGHRASNPYNSMEAAAKDAHDDQKHSAWRAPDSWDVTDVGFYTATGSAPVSESDSDTEKDKRSESRSKARSGAPSRSSSRISMVSQEGEVITPQPGDAKKHRKRRGTHPAFPERKLPGLYGALASRPVHSIDPKHAKGPNHIVRIFKDDNTFTTILSPLETPAAELLVTIQKKFFLDSISNFQLALYVGSNVKLLEPFEKPLKIQSGLLQLSGYTEDDNLKMIGREDLSFICKIVVENMSLRNLTHEEEASLPKNYVNGDISSHNLKTIPIIFHQHTYEIETLNVSDNPAIYIPLDFIQSCTNLSHIKFSRNGCSKFPLNFLEATSLTSLAMDANLMDEIPARISHLKNLESLKLNSNQLYFLPKSFGKLVNITTLNLSSNYFQEYPECINELVNLQDLDLSYNDLSYIPDSISKLTKLTKLNLCTNKLSKSLPKGMGKLLLLKRLDIRYNKISNIDVLGSLPNLEVMYASKNAISSFSDKMERLRLLHFDRNPITSLSFEIMLHMLTVLDLSKAQIAEVPRDFVNKIPHVEKLVLDKNHLVNVPEEFGNLPKLTHLSLFGNNIQNIPTSFGKLSSLQYLDLHSNNIEKIPSEIWLLKSLHYMNVSSNILSSFPKPSFEIVKKMTSSTNDQIPDSLEQVNAVSASAVHTSSSSLADCLTFLSIADNRLTDDSFEAIALLVNLVNLNMSYNDLTEIPEGALARLTKLTELYLSGNELTKLPSDDLEELTELRGLFVNGNKLQTLPPELSKCKQLSHLDAGSNVLRYNISNWPYDWNWCYNKRLRYLNFSGNKRFEIKQSYVQNPETEKTYDNLLVLDELRVLGLMDVTLTTPSVPDQTADVRVRTTSSELANVGYGISDVMGNTEAVCFRDLFLQKFRGNDDEVLIMSCEGIGSSSSGKGNMLSFLAKQLFVPLFTQELDRIRSDDEIESAIRKAFLGLNKEINSVFASKKAGFPHTSTASPDLDELTLEDASKGSCISMIYLKNGRIYAGNVGDIEIMISKSNADYKLLSTKHDPTSRNEFERIRATGGFVTGDGQLDGALRVSRGVGFFNYIPHTHCGPSVSVYDPAGGDVVIIMASSVLWDYVNYDLAVDIARQEKDDPMVAAEKLRDHAICYGATDRITVTVVSIGNKKKKREKTSSAYMNLGRETELFTGKKRKERGAGDNALRRLSDEIEPPIGNLALVFTDIKNSTLLWDAYPVSMRSAIKLHNTIMRRQLRIVGGYEVKTEGDSFMVSFPTPTAALLWCFNVQKQLLVEDWPTQILETGECCVVNDKSGNVIYRGLSVRMGIHWGSPVCELDMVTRRMDYFGPMVNRASRIESSADGGQIAVSADFMSEMEQLYTLHEQMEAGATTLAAAYEGNPEAGEIIEREISALEEAGCTYYELGQRKLKGLEAPETIVLAYPASLAVRYEIFRKSLSDDTTGRGLGAIPIHVVFALRRLSLKLENICSVLSCGYNGSEDSYMRPSTEIYQNGVKSDFQEKDAIGLFNHLVTRLENTIATLEMRQSYEVMKGREGRIDFLKSIPLWTMVDEIRELMVAAGRKETQSSSRITEA